MADFEFGTGPSIVGNISAQVDSNGIGCRILVNGVLKAASISRGVNAFALWLLKAA